MVKVVNDESAVSFRFFLAIVGVLITVQGLTATWMNNRARAAEEQVAKLEQKVETLNQQVGLAKDSYAVINANLAEIKTDILWIRKGLDDHMKQTK